MLNQFFLERELLTKIQRIEKLCRTCKIDVTCKIKQKALHLNIKIPAELQSKMCETVQIEDEKKFDCKFCGKEFNDGRKLGGHMSRAHPHYKMIHEFDSKCKIKKQKFSSQSDSSSSYSLKTRTRSNKCRKIKKLTQHSRFSMVKKQQESPDEYIKQEKSDDELFGDQ